MPISIVEIVNDEPVVVYTASGLITYVVLHSTEFAMVEHRAGIGGLTNYHNVEAEGSIRLPPLADNDTLKVTVPSKKSTITIVEV